MAQTPHYSTLFSCLHDEPHEYGRLGRGSHYSVFRSVEWLDVVRARLERPEIHDFAVIWDEDHDTRVIEAVERLYLAGLLSPVQFIGERKGNLTLVVAARFYFASDIADYQRQVQAAIAPLSDHWPVEIGMFDRSGAKHAQWHQTDAMGLIAADDFRVNVYLANIDSLWSLGTKPYVWPAEAPGWGNMPAPPPQAPPGVPVR
uniref:Uncharacterized protein n=1 Tax=Caulobacter sp. (strain K31) TaxID=366602 RepID=B0T9C1_CAUSK